MSQSKRIAFPSLNGSKITGHFGRLKQFVVVETEDGKELSRSARHRNDVDESGQARPHHLVILDMVADCDLVIAGGMGLPMVDNLKAQGVDLVLTSERDIDRALELYLEGNLVHESSKAHAPDHH